MSIHLVIFIFIAAISAFRGYRSGIVVIVFRIISIVFGYIATILFTDSFAHWLQQISPVKGIIAYGIAGTILFAITSISFSFLFSSVTRKMAVNSVKISKVSALTGGVFGGLVGGIFGILIIWFISAFQGILQVKNGENIVHSSFQKMAQKIVGGAIEGVVNIASGHSDISTGAAQLLSNPAENIQYFNRLTQKGVLRNMFQDSTIREALDSQNPHSLLTSPAYQQLVDNADFIALTKSFNLAEDKQKRDKQLAVKITQTWAQIKQVQNNQEYIEIMQDPEVKQNLQSGNAFKLLSSEKIERLLEIISTSKIPEINFQENSGQVDTSIKSKEQTIYRWIDKNGKVHYSDKRNRRDQ